MYTELIIFLKNIDSEMKEKDANIFKLHYKRNRYIYEMLKDRSLDKDTYKKLIKYNLADATLINFWNTPGYEKLCCIRCIQTLDHKNSTVCKCRVPIEKECEKFYCANYL